MDNNRYGRYSGEIQICKKELPQDARVNTIGFIHPQFIEILSYIGSGTTIVFTPIGHFE